MVRNNLQAHVGDVDVAAVPCGFGRAIGNKMRFTNSACRNFISGIIPKSLARIPLVRLSLMGNRNTGPIPDEIDQITTLQKLALAANFFNGTLPSTLANLKNPKEFRLNGNAFYGKLADFLGSLANHWIFKVHRCRDRFHLACLL